MEKNGYTILRNGFQPSDCLKYVTNDTVNYTAVKKIIDETLLSTVTKGLVENPTYRRFTFYHSRYPSTTSVYHKNSYNYLAQDTLPIYCAMLFMDKGSVEVIDGSHRKSSPSTFQHRVLLQLNKGDVLVVNACLMLRDINTGDETRILKIMDILGNRDKYADKMILVQASKSLIIRSLAIFLAYASRWNILITPINLANYLLVYYGIQYSFLLEDIPLISRHNMIVNYDTNPIITGGGIWNHTVICDNTYSIKWIGNWALVLSFIVLCLCAYYIDSSKIAYMLDILKQKYDKFKQNTI